MSMKAMQKPQPSKETIAAREKLAQAGLLSIELGIPEDIAPVSEEELEQLGKMSPEARSSEDLLNDERGNF